MKDKLNDSSREELFIWKNWIYLIYGSILSYIMFLTFNITFLIIHIYYLDLSLLTVFNVYLESILLVILFILYFMSRRKIIKHFHKYREVFLYNLYVTSNYYFLIFMIYLGFIYTIIHFDIIKISSPIVISSFPIIWFFTISYIMFNNSLKECGKRKIEFRELRKNMNDYPKRERWLKKMYQNISSILIRGNIDISVDSLICHTNIKLMNNENIDNEIQHFEKWLLSKQKDDSILQSIKKIVPDTEIKCLTKPIFKDRLTYISTTIKSFPDLMNIIQFIGIIILLIIASKDPTLRPKLLEFFLNKAK